MMQIATVVRVVFVMGLLFAGAISAQEYRANLDGAQEAPPNGSAGTGLACLSLDANSMLSYEVSFEGLGSPEVAAHIHGPAAVGTNGPVIFPFAAGTPKVGVFGPLTAAQIADLNAGLLYVNIHTSGIPGGEIRGQILTSPVACTVAVEGKVWSNVKALYR